MANEAQDTRRSSHTEQQCNVCRQVVAVGDRGEVRRQRARRRARRTRERGRNQRQRDGGAQEATTEEQRWRDGGHNEGWTVARRWLPSFRLLFGGGARPATLTSWTEAQSAMERVNPDGGHGGGELREREDDEQ